MVERASLGPVPLARSNPYAWNRLALTLAMDDKRKPWSSVVPKMRENRGWLWTSGSSVSFVFRTTQVCMSGEIVSSNSKRVKRVHEVNFQGQKITVDEVVDGEDTDSVLQSEVLVTDSEQYIPFDKVHTVSPVPYPCQGCRFQFNSKAQGPMRQIYNFFEQNRDLPEEALAEQISQKFEDLVVEKSIVSGDFIEPWHKQSVLVHLREHMLDRQMILTRGVRRLEKLQQLILDKTVQTSGVLDKNSVIAFLNVSKQQVHLLASLESLKSQT